MQTGDSWSALVKEVAVYEYFVTELGHSNTEFGPYASAVNANAAKEILKEMSSDELQQIFGRPVNQTCLKIQGWPKVGANNIPVTRYELNVIN
ncbi:hypothetical protein PHABIO_403 [Pseudomonas phage Phabio]|uniref:Uncharacterized protein n=1 Tax=Pseudomonas phage Phabio TaxID=2006668 RepID=A0A1Y0SWR8_9CAUD|nr:hypothetical protein MZD05_gp403 [Pseudomonas phage Phabio]ARV77034.1 hypothetical protein PHABIO_403 [Pseudomonas phage Phabio]